ncbi:MAG: DUF4177 domain-containing protein [Robiginitomaculum sp.]|nr:DUF4177 domain-containing protein [Robiginitomaculum sp.]
MRNRWSYKVEHIKYEMFTNRETRNSNIEDTLNRLGMEGWEMVEVMTSPGGSGLDFYLKRPS